MSAARPSSTRDKDANRSGASNGTTVIRSTGLRLLGGAALMMTVALEALAPFLIIEKTAGSAAVILGVFQLMNSRFRRGPRHWESERLRPLLWREVVHGLLLLGLGGLALAVDPNWWLFLILLGGLILAA